MSRKANRLRARVKRLEKVAWAANYRRALETDRRREAQRQLQSVSVSLRRAERELNRICELEDLRETPARSFGVRMCMTEEEIARVKAEPHVAAAIVVVYTKRLTEQLLQLVVPKPEAKLSVEDFVKEQAP